MTQDFLVTMTVATNKIVHKLDAIQIAKLCAEAALDKKAGNLSILDVSKLTSFTDCFVICSAPSERQVQAIVRNVQEVLGAHSLKHLGLEGFEQGAWVLLDLGDVIFHCFTDDAREYYDLEGFWIDAPKVEL
jgi:ribosome-associated protein